MVDIKELTGSTVVNRSQIPSARALEDTVSNNSVSKEKVCANDKDELIVGREEKLCENNTEVTEIETDRSQCCCRCHYQRNPLRNCPFNSKSPKHTCFSTTRTTGRLLCGEHRLDLHNELTCVTTRSGRCSESLREYTSSRNRLKNETVPLNKNDNQTSEPESVYKNWRTRLTQKKRMLRILCQGFVVIVLCLCGGVLMINHHGNSKGNEIHKLPSVGFKPEDTESSGSTDIVKNLPFRSVPLDTLEQHIERARSAADVLKIFFDHPNLSDEAVNSIMWMKSHESIHGSKVTSHQKNQNIMNDVEGSEEEYRELAFNHHLEVVGSPLGSCSDPKPELEHIEDPQHNSFKQYYPHCTILHRCRNTTGCCPRGYTCGPKKRHGIQIVEKHFLVFKKSADFSVIPETKHFVETRNFINHTACECHRIETVTNCHKHCPHQFRKERPGADCICTCKPNNKKCRHIYRGLMPLDEKDLECIKQEKCILPKCHVGEFKIHSGFCPPFRHQRHKS